MTHADRRQTQTTEQYAADDLETMSLARRYGAHMYGLFEPFIGRRILEVGCGIGTVTRRLLDVADLVVAIEPNPNCAERAKQALGTHPKLTLHECLLEECDAAAMSAHRFDTIVCFNVLEHIADDAAALRTFHDLIVPGGHVLIWVPAIPAAYGPLDAELGHFRRYTKLTLRQAFAGSGLDLISLRYSNPIGLVGWMYNAHVTKSIAHSPGQVQLFETLVAPWALPLERMIPPPIGLSLVAVGKRRS